MAILPFILGEDCFLRLFPVWFFPIPREKGAEGGKSSYRLDSRESLTTSIREKVIFYHTLQNLMLMIKFQSQKFVRNTTESRHSGMSEFNSWTLKNNSSSGVLKVAVTQLR